jgi:hypothetical protein
MGKVLNDAVIASFFASAVGAAYRPTAADPLITFRNAHASNLAVINKIGLGFMGVVAAGAAGSFALELRIGRAFSVEHATGSSAITPSKKNANLPATAATMRANSGAAAISGGTVTLDTAPVFTVVLGLANAQIGANHRWVSLPRPIVLKPNEGLVVLALVTPPTSATYRAILDLDWDEVSPKSWID